MKLALTIILFVAVVLVVRRLVRAGPDARRDRLAGIATELGMQADRFDGLGARMAGKGARAAVGPDHPSQPLADAATAVFGERRTYHGTWNGRAVSLGALPVRRYRVAVAAECRLPPGIGLWAHPRRKAIADPPEKTTVVQSGDADLDGALTVAARDAVAAGTLLSRAGVRAALMQITALEAAFVHGQWVYVSPYGDALSDASAARRLLDQVTAVAAQIDLALDSDPPRDGDGAL